MASGLKTQRGAMQAILFDLDNTLYGEERALFALIDVRINRYMHEVLGIEEPDVDRLRRRYWQHYGVTLQGLIREHQADPEHYLDYVHDIDVSSRLVANPLLRDVLHALPQRKFVFTNGSLGHARRVLECLQIEDCFEQIFDIRTSHYTPKPQQQPYDALLEQTQLSAQQCVMVEDSLENLRTAARLGMKTIWVTTAPPAATEFDAAIAQVEQVGTVVHGWMTRKDKP